MSDFVLPSDMDPPRSAAAPSSTGSFVLPSDMGADGKPLPPPSTMTSMAEAPFVGFNKGLANTLGAPVDAANWAMGKIGLPTSNTPFLGSQSIKNALGVAGMNPDDRAPRSETEKLLQSAGEGAASMVVPEAALAGAGRAGLAAVAPRATEALQSAFGSASSVPAVLGNAASGAVAGGAGQAASDLAPDRYKPVAGMAASLVGGAGAATALHGAGLAADYGVKAARDFAEPITGKSAPVMSDAGVPLRSATGDVLTAKPGQLDVAGRMLASKATDASATLDALQTAPREIVPGSQPTTFQVTGDMGLGGLERTIANSDNDTAALFQQRRSDQNAARVDAMAGLEKDGLATDVPGFLAQELKAIDAQHAQQVQSAQQAAQAAASGIGGQSTPEAIGNAMRDSLQSARDEAKARERSLWQAVDPDGTLALDVTPIKQAAQKVIKSMPEAAAPMAGEEAGSFAAAKAFPDIHSFNEVSALRSRLNTAMRQEMMTNGQSPAHARMTQLRGAVETAIQEAASNKAAQEQHAVAAGLMQPEDTIEARIAAVARDRAQAYTDQSARSAGVGVGDGSGFGHGSPSYPSPAGAGRPTSRRLSDASGDPGVPQAPLFDDTEVTHRPAAPPFARPRSLEDFIRDSGGIQDPGGDLRSMGFGNVRGFIAKPGNGLTPDRMREAAAEAGYLGPDIDRAMSETSINDLLDALGSSDPVYSVRDEHGVDAWGAYDEQRARYDRVNGPKSQSARPPQAPISAYNQSDAYPAGALVPNFDQAAADRLSAANTATKNRAQTFDQGAVGTVLRNQGTRGNYRMLDALVPSTIFKPKAEGYQTAQAYLKAAASQPEALTNLHDAAALSMRKKAVGSDGTVDPNKLATWQAEHADALRAMPGLASKFASAAKATETLNDLAAARKAALDDFQSGTVGNLIGANDATTVKRTVGSIFGKRDAVAQMKRLAAITSKSPEAQQGLRRAIADHMADQFLSNAEAGTSGKNQIKADALQTFIRKNEAVLAQVFKPDELKSMKAVAADLQRANRSIVAVKNPGGSNTTQDMRSANAHDEHGAGTLGGKLWKAALVAGEVTGPIAKIGVFAGTVGKHLVDSMRSAGLRTVNDLVKEAMLNPDLAQVLLQRASKVPDRGSELTLAHKLGRIGMFSAVNGATQH